MIEIKVPTVGESITEVQLLRWNKKTGDYVERDEVIAELESEKATFEVNAEQSGLLTTAAAEGDTLQVGDLLATIDDAAKAPAKPAAPAATTAAAAPKPPAQVELTAPKPPAVAATAPMPTSVATPVSEEIKASPVASAIIADKKVDPKKVKPSGPQGKILKDDVLAALANPGRIPAAGSGLNERNTRSEKMSNLRKTIAKRLVEAKNGTAMLTTFNEVDMGAIMEVRSRFKDKFKEIHGVNLGFMSFFAKACSIALTEWPAVNASIEGDQILYHDYTDISIAVSTPRGLTVPVMRNVESLGMAEIEKKVIELAGKARDSKLTAEELTGGTFTITNGGVFGSLMSTPIINTPQSAILGMHKIQERPMAVNGQVVIRPMMYIALSYDHRIIDGRESVSFLVRVKELLEHPEQLLIGKDPVKTLLEI
jgi:2-oxoglutarate dehydrogenase E2 component (dihydrolipoamide succinyltransferase)